MNKITVQNGRATHVVAYVHWENEEIISEAEYEAKLEEETNIAAADDYHFGEWLDKYYTAINIWNMSEEEKEEVNAQWLKYCRESMEYELGYERRVLI